MYIWLLNIYWSIFMIPHFPSQLQPISACECIILWVSETDPAVCYHKNSWSSNMRIPTSANLNMRTQTDFQTRPLIRIWLSKKRHSKTRLDYFPQHTWKSHFNIYDKKVVSLSTAFNWFNIYYWICFLHCFWCYLFHQKYKIYLKPADWIMHC